MSGIAGKLTVAIADRYVIEREPGQGGMTATAGRRAGGPADGGPVG